MNLDITGIDHLVLTVTSIPRSLYFYCSQLGMKEISFGEGRKAIQCGMQKINLHEIGKEFAPKANNPTPGSADICLVVNSSIETVIKLLNRLKIPILEGPVERTGANGKIHSVYIRDPDFNLIELARYQSLP